MKRLIKRQFGRVTFPERVHAAIREQRRGRTVEQTAVLLQFTGIDMVEAHWTARAAAVYRRMLDRDLCGGRHVTWMP